MTSEEYKAWLENKLNQHRIDKNKLIATVIVVERILSSELSRRGSIRSKPYYKLYKEDGTKTVAWVHAAELALWLNYNGFKAAPYVEAIVHHPEVKSFVNNKADTHQIPLNKLFPSARVSTERLKSYSRHFKAWFIKH